MEVAGGPVGGAPSLTAGTNDDSALRDLYDTHSTVLLRFTARLLGGDRHRAEDIVQETLLRAWRHPESRTADGGWSRAWLFTVARRIVIDHLRAQGSRPTEVTDERLAQRPQPDDQIEQLLDRREVRAALETLPPRLRDALIEVYFRQRSVSEAAQVLGVPPGTIKSRTFYALRALRAALQERGFPSAGG